MRSNEDDEFREYLRQFRPLDAAPLQVRDGTRVVTRPFRLPVRFATAAACLMAILFSLFILRRQPSSSHTAIGQGTTRALDESAPLTLGSANALLARSTSAKSTLDQMAFGPRSVRIPEGQQSTLAVLNKEKTKL